MVQSNRPPASSLNYTRSRIEAIRIFAEPRAPTNDDSRGFAVRDFWLDTTTQRLYYFVGVQPHLWVRIYTRTLDPISATVELIGDEPSITGQPHMVETSPMGEFFIQGVPNQIRTQTVHGAHTLQIGFPDSVVIRNLFTDLQSTATGGLLSLSGHTITARRGDMAPSGMDIPLILNTITPGAGSVITSNSPFDSHEYRIRKPVRGALSGDNRTMTLGLKPTSVADGFLFQGMNGPLEVDVDGDTRFSHAGGTVFSSKFETIPEDEYLVQIDELPPLSSNPLKGEGNIDVPGGRISGKSSDPTSTSTANLILRGQGDGQVYIGTSDVAGQGGVERSTLNVEKIVLPGSNASIEGTLATFTSATSWSNVFRTQHSNTTLYIGELPEAGTKTGNNIQARNATDGINPTNAIDVVMPRIATVRQATQDASSPPQDQLGLRIAGNNIWSIGDGMTQMEADASVPGALLGDVPLQLNPKFVNAQEPLHPNRLRPGDVVITGGLQVLVNTPVDNPQDTPQLDKGLRLHDNTITSFGVGPAQDDPDNNLIAGDVPIQLTPKSVTESSGMTRAGTVVVNGNLTVTGTYSGPGGPAGFDGSTPHTESTAGTFLPQLMAGSHGGFTYDRQQGSWARVGNLVFFSFFIELARGPDRVSPDAELYINFGNVSDTEFPFRNVALTNQNTNPGPSSGYIPLSQWDSIGNITGPFTLGLQPVAISTIVGFTLIYSGGAIPSGQNLTLLTSPFLTLRNIATFTGVAPNLTTNVHASSFAASGHYFIM